MLTLSQKRAALRANGKEQQFQSNNIQLTKSGYKIIETDSVNLLCGLYALRRSIEKQLPCIPKPTIQELQAIVNSGVVAKRVKDTQLTENFQNNFSVDLLAAALHEYGKLHNRNLELGVCWEGREPYILKSEERNDCNTIWAHNSNTPESKGYSHYSGMFFGPDMTQQSSVVSVTDMRKVEHSIHNL